MKTQIEILKQKLLDTEEDHTTGITREEVECIKTKLDSLENTLRPVDTALRRCLAFILNLPAAITFGEEAEVLDLLHDAVNKLKPLITPTPKP
jgi:hypothetical protein